MTLQSSTPRGVGVELRDAELTLGAGSGAENSRAGRVRELAVLLELGTSAGGSGRRVPGGAVVRASAPAADVSRRASPAPFRLARRLFGDALADGAKVEVGALRARLGYRDEALGFGPSRVTVSRAAREIALAVLPAERPLTGSTPLSLGLRLPLDDGAPALELEGGPVALGALGVREGDLGLRRVREATLEAHARVDLLPGAGALRGSGSGRFVNLSLARPELAPQELRGLGVAFRAAGEARLDGSRVALDDAELAVGDVRLATTFSAERDRGGTSRALEGRRAARVVRRDARFAAESARGRARWARPRGHVHALVRARLPREQARRDARRARREKRLPREERASGAVAAKVSLGVGA